MTPWYCDIMHEIYVQTSNVAFQTTDINGETVSTGSAKFNFDSIIENMREFTRLMREKYKKVVSHRTSLKLA